MARAVGLGGVWINEHRARFDWERIVGLQCGTLARLPAGEELLRHRLLTRLASEAVYRGGPIEPVLAALTRQPQAVVYTERDLHLPGSRAESPPCLERTPPIGSVTTASAPPLPE